MKEGSRERGDVACGKQFPAALYLIATQEKREIW